MRCDACGGLNPADADWCGQCLRRFSAPPPPPPRASDAVEPERAPLHVVTQEDAPGAPPSHAVGTERGAFKVTQQGVTWTCKACDSENPMESSSCAVCGTALAHTLRPPEPERPARDPNMTAMISLLMPGAGHGYLGLWPQAIARMVLQAWVLAAALIGAISGSLFLGIIFGIASFALWLTSAHDSFREASGQPSLVLLKGRAFLWIVLGLLSILMIVVVMTALGAPSATPS